MPIYVNKPEFALKRAEEFLDVGKKTRALEALTEAIKNRKQRIWQKSHEDIMRKFIELCVELKQSQTAKEGLHQYKNLTANVNPKSLEDIIRYYLKLSENKCDAAREKANVNVSADAAGKGAVAPIVDVDDLDLAESPEGMLLKVVSTDTSQDRADRVLLLPWVRFNWEAYRHCLDLLRNLSKLEALYHDIASQAFKFCLKYVRKTELRKLCEMLRNHIGQISKREVITANSVNLSNPETQELNLRTRLVQLDHAIAMEMWQEAFRAIEDVHGLMSMLKKVPKAALKANYFEKLALVFLRAGNAVFHAAAQHQLFNLYRNFRKDLNPEELRKLAVAVLLATLAVPLQPPRSHLETLLEYDDNAASKMKQLTMLVGYTQAPTRAKLVEDLQKSGILQFVRPELQALFTSLEVAFDPLLMGGHVAGVLTLVNSSEELAGLRHYLKAIEEVAVGKQLRQLSQAYDSIEIERVASLMPYTDESTIERVAIETARNTDLEVRIDHRTPKLFVFGSEVALAPYESEESAVSSETQVPTDRVRSQLVSLLSALTRTHRVTKSHKEMDDESLIRGNLFNLYRKNASRDHANNLSRPQKTDVRQRVLEQREREKALQDERAKRSRDNELAVADDMRLAHYNRQREDQRTKQKERELEQQFLRKKIENMRSTEFGMRVLKELNEEDLSNLDIKELEKLEQKHKEELKREEDENTARLKVQEKKIDHTVRARHLEEVALRTEHNQEMVAMFQQAWQEAEEERIRIFREDREFALMKREKMRRMLPERTACLEEVVARKQQLYESKLADWERNFKKEKRDRLEARRRAREEERRTTYMRKKEEEEQARLEEEAAAREEEERAKKHAAETEARRKLDEQLARQREREREIEEKQRSQMEPVFSVNARDRERQPVGGPGPLVRQPVGVMADVGAPPAAPAAAPWRRGQAPSNEPPTAEVRGEVWRGGAGREERRDQRPELELRRPELELRRPDVELRRPDVELRRPDGDAHPAEARGEYRGQERRDQRGDVEIRRGEAPGAAGEAPPPHFKDADYSGPTITRRGADGEGAGAPTAANAFRPAARDMGRDGGGFRDNRDQGGFNRPDERREQGGFQRRFDDRGGDRGGFGRDNRDPRRDPRAPAAPAPGNWRRAE